MNLIVAVDENWAIGCKGIKADNEGFWGLSGKPVSIL